MWMAFDFNINFNRFNTDLLEDKKWKEESIHEGEVRTYWVKYPTLQRMAGRNFKHSPIHEKMAENGAFFGSAGGYERPLFFLDNNEKLTVCLKQKILLSTKLFNITLSGT